MFTDLMHIYFPFGTDPDTIPYDPKDEYDVSHLKHTLFPSGVKVPWDPYPDDDTSIEEHFSTPKFKDHINYQ